MVQISIISGGRELPTIPHQGRTFVMVPTAGTYALRVRNMSNDRFETVVAVDGKNIIDGSDARPDGAGYVLNPFQAVDIPGWRRGAETTATFTFTPAAQSYGAQMGTASSVGVIAMAVFAEKRRLRESPLTFGTGDVMRGGDSGRRTRGGYERCSSSLDSAPTKSVGTGYGAETEFKTSTTTFERASTAPERVTVIQYATREELVAWGVPVPAEIPEPVIWPGAKGPSVQAPPGWSGK